VALSEAFVTILADDTRFTADARAKLAADLLVVERKLKPVKIKVALDAPSVRGLKASIRDATAALSASLSAVKVKVAADATGFGTGLKQTIQTQLTAIQGALKSIKIKSELDNSSVQRIGGDLRGIVTVLNRTLPAVQLKVEVSAAGATTDARARLTADLAVIERKLPPIKIGVTLDPVSVRGLRTDLRGIIRILSRTLDPVVIRVRLEPDDAQIATQLADLDALRAHLQRTITTTVRVDGDRDADRGLNTVERDTGRLLSGFLGLVKGALSLNIALAGIGAKAGAAAVAISGITVAVSAGAHGLAQLTGGINTFIGAAVGAALVGVTLKIALLGVGDAFAAVASGDSEKAAEALKSLSPAARSVALEFDKALPKLKRFQLAVQQSVFKGLKGDITLLTAQLPKLQGGFTGVGTQLGLAGGAFARFLAKASTIKDLNTILASTAKLIKPVTDKLIELAGSGLSRAAEGSKTMGDRFTAIGGALRKVGQGLKDVGIFFSGFSEAVNVAVAPAVDRLKDAFAGVTLTQDTFREGGRKVGVLVGDLANNFLLLVGVISSSLGPALTILAQPLLDIVNAFASIDRTILESLGPALTTLAPLFVSIGTVISTGVLPFLQAIIGAIGDGLTGVLAIVVPIAQRFIDVLGPALAAVAPQAKEFIDALFDAVTALITPVAEHADVLLPRFKKLLGDVGPVLTTMTRVIREIVIPILQRFGDHNASLIDLLGGILDVCISLTGIFLKVAKGFLDMMAAFKKSSAGQALVGLFDNITGHVNGLISAIGDAIGLVGKLLDKVSSLSSLKSSLSFDIPFFADGGIVGSGTLAVVGEAGKEAIVPLTDPARALAISEESGLADLIRNSSGGQQFNVIIGTRDRLLASVVDVRVEAANNSNARRTMQGVRQ
jgi:hypothetical protein